MNPCRHMEIMQIQPRKAPSLGIEPRTFLPRDNANQLPCIPVVLPYRPSAYTMHLLENVNINLLVYKNPQQEPSNKISISRDIYWIGALLIFFFYPIGIHNSEAAMFPSLSSCPQCCRSKNKDPSCNELKSSFSVCFFCLHLYLTMCQAVLLATAFLLITILRSDRSCGKQTGDVTGMDCIRFPTPLLSWSLKKIMFFFLFYFFTLFSFLMSPFDLLFSLPPLHSSSLRQFSSTGISCNRPVQMVIDGECWGFVVAL